ncbi:MAG: helix-turn-helix transcriptional regulator [Minisyncoccia bacterium]
MIEEFQHAEKPNSQENFVVALKNILDTTGISRSEWAKFLGVSQAAISVWVMGRSFPGPEILATIINVTEKKHGANFSKLQALKDCLYKTEPFIRPGKKQPKHKEGYGDNIMNATIAQIKDNLQKLSPPVQERILGEFARMVFEALKQQIKQE